MYLGKPGPDAQAYFPGFDLTMSIKSGMLRTGRSLLTAIVKTIAVVAATGTRSRSTS